MNLDRYKQHLTRFRVAFAEHRLTPVVVTDALRAYWLRKPGTGLMGAFVVCGPTGTTISGDIRFRTAPTAHADHCGWRWWVSQRLHSSPGYLREKFGLPPEWDADLAEAGIREWLSDDSQHCHRSRRPTWDDDFAGVDFTEKRDVYDACAEVGMEAEDVPGEVWITSEVAMLAALQEAFVRELAKEEVEHAGA